VQAAISQVIDQSFFFEKKAQENVSRTLYFLPLFSFLSPALLPLLHASQ